jgi:hypothetical protein
VETRLSFATVWVANHSLVPRNPGLGPYYGFTSDLAALRAAAAPRDLPSLAPFVVSPRYARTNTGVPTGTVRISARTSAVRARMQPSEAA